MLIFQAVMLIFVREENVQVKVEETTPIRELFQVIIHNDQLLWTTVAMALFMIGYTTTTSFGLYYFEFVYGDKDMYSIFALVLGISQITALAVFPAFSRRFSRKVLYRAATVLVVLGYLIFYPAEISMVLIGIAGVLIFVGQAFIQLIMLMFIADCVEYGQWKLGRRNDSITLSLQPLINKIGGAAASGIVGLTVVFSGMKNASGPKDISPQGVTLFKTAMLIVPLLLIAAGYFVYAAKYKIDEDTYRQIVKEIEATKKADP
jgi:Na+/melibiose symporter-like transporter